MPNPSPSTNAKPGEKPEVKPPEPTGKEQLKSAVRGTIDYSEDTTPAEVKPEVKPEVTKPTKVDPSVVANARLIQDALQRQQIAEREAIKAQTERDMLKQQVEGIVNPKPQDMGEEELTQLAVDSPLKAMQIVSEQTARKVKEQTMAEVTQQGQQQAAQDTRTGQMEQFADNIAKVHSENTELADPNHRLNQIYIGLEKEFPMLMHDPEGPLKAIQLARDRYQLEQFKSGEAKPDAVKIAEKQGQEAEAARQESVRVAQIVSGPSRSAPPTTSVELSDDQKLAARKMRIAPEEYAGYIKNSPHLFKKEEAPRKRAVV